MNSIDAMTLKNRLTAQTGHSLPLLLDVREPHETALCKIADSVLMPLGEIRARLNELPHDREIIVICHHGMRSQHAGMLLENAGFPRITNLSGGIDAWATLVEPGMVKY